MPNPQCARNGLALCLKSPGRIHRHSGNAVDAECGTELPVGDGRGLPREQVEKLKAHRWVRNFYE
jgi:hypothetical protein